MSAQPWMKFYPTDWRSDPCLRMCSLGARGLWIEMIMLMHEATPYGHLLVAGRAPTDAQLAVLAGTSPDQISDLLGELESAAVFSRTTKGVIYSRRMTRDDKKARIARKNGSRGGNPSLCKEREISSSVNQIPTEEVKPQKPDTRVQSLEEKKESYVSDQMVSGMSKPSSEASGTVSGVVAKPEDNGTFELLPLDLEPVTSDLDAKFEDFWQAYPRRASGEGKQDAKGLFVTAVRRGVEADFLIRCAEAYRECMILDGSTTHDISGRTNFVMQACKFLNFSKKRWEEWPDVLARKRMVSNNVRHVSFAKQNPQRPRLGGRAG